MADTSGGSQSASAEGLTHAYYPYHGRVSTGTPLSNIPERAIHAQPFQPPAQAYGQGYYGHYNQPGYYYPPAYQPMSGFPHPPPSEPPAPQGNTAGEAAAQSSSGTVAHESNGMVYYLDAAQMPQFPQQEAYPRHENFLQPHAIPGMGGMMTPSPESGYYYPPAPAGPVYYPQAQ